MSIKTNIVRATIQERLTDAEYIKKLEEDIRDIDARVEQFMQAMDKSMFQRDSQKVMEAYADNVKLLIL